MDDILGRVSAILFAALIFTGLPLYYLTERVRSAEQMYLLTINTEFVDSICNTGVLTEDVYERLLNDVAAASGVYEVEILHEQKDIVYEEQAYHYVSSFFDETDIRETFFQGEDYFLAQGDFLKVLFRQVKQGIHFPWEAEKGEHIFYGGTVRYEAF